MASTERLLRIVIKMDSSGVTSGLGQATNSLKSFGSQLQSIGNTMTATLTLPIVALGAASVKMATDFDTSLHNIQSITGQTDESIKKLGNGLLELSQTNDVTVDSAQNLADAYYDVVSSGFAGNDAMKVLYASTKAASAGLTTTKVAVQGVAGVLNAYGLSASHATEVSDIMFQTVNRGVVTFEQLNSSLGNVTGVASQLGVSFEEVGASIATMTKQNIDAATATTNLNAILTSLINPTTAMQDAFKAMGYESGSAMLSALGLGGTLQKISEYSGGSAEKMQQLFGNVRALRGALALTGKGAQMFSDDLNAMQNAGGSTAAAFAEQSKSFEFQWKHFMNVLNATMIEFGQVILPVLSKFLEAIYPIIQQLGNLDDGTKQWIVGLLAVVAALGPIISIIGGLIGFFTTLGSILPVITGGLAAFGTALVALLSPLGLFVAAIALIALAIINNWFGIRDAIISGATVIVENLSKVGDAFKGVGGMIASGWQAAISKAWDNLVGLVSQIGTIFSKLGQLGWTIGTQFMQGMWNGIAEGFKKLVVMLLGKVNEIIAGIRNAFGIHSPSKVMADIGKNVVLGFHKGVQNMGGIGVNVAQSGRTQPSLGYAGASAGGATVQNNFYITSQGTSEEQIKHITKEVSKNIQKESVRRGAKKLK